MNDSVAVYQRFSVLDPGSPTTPVGGAISGSGIPQIEKK
jgi:hypothetical protein